MNRPGVTRAKQILASAARSEARNELAAAAGLYTSCYKLLKRLGRDPQVAALRVRCLCGSAAVLREEGHYARAEAIYHQALRRAERDLGSDHRDLFIVLNDLGVLYKYAGRFIEAGQAYQRALAICEKHLGARHRAVATIYHNLGGLEHAAGNYARAESFARHALKLRRQLLGAGHPDLATERAALAPILDGRRKFDEAARLYRVALPALQRTLGTSHPDVVTALNNFAANAQARHRPAEAERLYRRTLTIKQDAFGPDHPSVGITLNNLAVLLKQRKKYVEADATFRRALMILERGLGSRHANVAACLDNYAQLLRRTHRGTRARQLEARAQRIRKGIETLTDDNVAVTAMLNPQFTRFHLSVRPSKIHRWGVYAEEPIPAGRKVIEYAGERISRHANIAQNPKRIYLYALDRHTAIDGASGGSGAEFINHSCDPNLTARKGRRIISFFSTRAIARDTELTVDYRFSNKLKKIACRCGAPTCRGTINLP
jgi:tetratricopeptide (TPR) repeat protein